MISIGPYSSPRGTQSDWRVLRESIDLVSVMRSLLGPSLGRKGEHGSRLWWRCPFHQDKNPSLGIEPSRKKWKCFGCGERGDAVDLVMKLRSCTFPQAIGFLRQDGNATAHSEVRSGSPSPRGSEFLTISDPARNRTDDRAGDQRVHRSLLSLSDSLSLVESSAVRLWRPEGLRALDYLKRRGLSDDTIRSARVGWTPEVRLPTRKEGRSWSASGIVIPWFDGDRLTLVKIRQPEGMKPKYAEAFRDRPTIYPMLSVIRPGNPVVVVEGEFDALLLTQAIGDVAAVVTLGSASARPEASILERLLVAPAWFIASDADDAGDRCASEWRARARRVKPPDPYNDWTDLAKDFVNLRRWWSERLAGIENPEAFTYDEARNHPEAREERAAIMEFDGGLNREAAERAAGCRK